MVGMSEDREQCELCPLQISGTESWKDSPVNQAKLKNIVTEWTKQLTGWTWTETEENGNVYYAIRSC